MEHLYYVFGTAAVIVAVGLWHLVRKTFDPFAPIWVFLLGYFQVYVIQAISYHEYAIRVRGADLVSQANERALLALVWFVLVYSSGIGRAIAKLLPRAPEKWSTGMILSITPPMVIWGLICSGLVLMGDAANQEITPEEYLLRQFPILMLAAGILLVVTGRQLDRPRPLLTATGLLIAGFYVALWMFNGKRSHSLIGVLTTVAAYYLPRGRRPSAPVLLATAFAGALAVSVAIGWRNESKYERSFSGFGQFLSEFNLSSILVNLNMKQHNEDDSTLPEKASHETEEYGGYLLMMDTVPAKSEYDYGASYIRLVSTYIPRIIWSDKPYFGREQWVNAWIAGSEFKRDSKFTGPAIGILGATQLNGGIWATVIVLAVVAVMIRAAYEYFRLHAHTAWAQAWWALTYYNAWLMTVNDDPFVWFYYLYGHTMLPPLVFLWVVHRLGLLGGGK